MGNEKYMQIVAEKIKETQAAIFYCLSKSPLRIPNSVIRSSTVDDNGNISFFINRPAQLISQFEQEFPAELHFFKKGNSFKLSVFGKARIVADPEELSYLYYLAPNEVEKALTTHVLIRVQIIEAHFQNSQTDKRSYLFKHVQTIYQRLFSSVFSTTDVRYKTGTAIQHYGF